MTLPKWPHSVDVSIVGRAHSRDLIGDTELIPSDRGSTTIPSREDFMAFRSSTRSTPTLFTSYLVKILAFEALSPAVDDGGAHFFEPKFFVDEGSWTHLDVIPRRVHGPQIGIESLHHDFEVPARLTVELAS